MGADDCWNRFPGTRDDCLLKQVGGARCCHARQLCLEEKSRSNKYIIIILLQTGTSSEFEIKHYLRKRVNISTKTPNWNIWACLASHDIYSNIKFIYYYDSMINFIILCLRLLFQRNKHCMMNYVRIALTKFYR